MLLISINLCGIFIIYQVIQFILIIPKIVHLHTVWLRRAGAGRPHFTVTSSDRFKSQVSKT